MNEKNKELLEREQENVLELIGRLDPADKNYIPSLDAVDKIERILSNDTNRNETAKLKDENERLRHENLVLKNKQEPKKKWYQDPTIINALLTVGGWGVELTALWSALTWEKENNFVSRVYDKIRNIFPKRRGF